MGTRIHPYPPNPPFWGKLRLSRRWRKIGKESHQVPWIPRQKKAATQVWKTKKNAKSRVTDPNFLYRLRNEPGEYDIFVSHGSNPVAELATTEERGHKGNPLPILETEVEMEVATS